MITYTKGNLLEADVQALVNTVNTVGIMGKGIALMFKDKYQENFNKYAVACQAGEVEVGRMFVTRTNQLMGPEWIINFPTKKHWKSPSKLEWIAAGLEDLKTFIIENNINSIALPPLGAGNGGLDWSSVKPLIENELGSIDANIVVFEPTDKYQNVVKKDGLKTLTPARALIAEVIRDYCSAGLECSLLEVQKLSWFMERIIEGMQLPNPLKLQFQPNKYGPYAHRLTKLLEGLDGSFIHCDKRISDASPLDTIWVDGNKLDYLETYLNSEAKIYRNALEVAKDLIEGFESPYGLELLATVDWLLHTNNVEPNYESIYAELERWPGGPTAAQRKIRIFDQPSIELALQRLKIFKAALN